MKPRTLTVRDYVRAFTRVTTPIANGMAKALTVNEYMSGRDQRSTDPRTFNAAPGVTQHPPRRPWQQKTPVRLATSPGVPRTLFRPGLVIPRRVAPLQSPAPFHQTTLP